MKKLVPSSAQVGLAAGLVYCLGAAIGHGATIAVNSFVYGATLGILFVLLNIPKKVCGLKGDLP